jgi:hypothetical protein
MSQVKFTDEELKKIKELQEIYQVLGIQLVQLKLTRKSAEDHLESLNQQQSQLDQQLFDANQQERDFAKVLNDKYGVGSLDLESGLFTPIETNN